MPESITVESAKAIELKPGKFYLLMFDRTAITLDDARVLQHLLRERDIQGITVMLHGPDGVTVVEAPGDNEQHDLSQIEPKPISHE